MQKEFKNIIFEIVKEICNVDKLLTVILFGSVAKNEADKRSDIDILIVLDTKKDVKNEKKEISRLILDLEHKFDKNIQVVFANKMLKGLDRQFIETVFKEGIVLYGNIPRIKTERLELEPYFILNYNTKDISNKNKMKLNRTLYGYKTKKKYKNKIYKTKFKGLIEEYEIRKIGPATLLIPCKKIKIFEDLLRNLSIKYNKIDVWISKV